MSRLAIRRHRRAAALTVGLVCVVGVLAAGPAAALATSSPEPCQTAECPGPRIEQDDPWDDEIEPDEGLRVAAGTGRSDSAAMLDALDEASDECPGGFKITDGDIAGSGTSWTVTLTYRCN